MKRIPILRYGVWVCLSVKAVLAQQTEDSIRMLEEVTIESIRLQTIDRLKPVQGTYIYAGKKSEVIDLSKTAVSPTENRASKYLPKFRVYLFRIGMATGIRLIMLPNALSFILDRAYSLPMAEAYSNYKQKTAGKTQRAMPAS